MTSALDISNRLTKIQNSLNDYKKLTLLEITQFYIEQAYLMKHMLQQFESEDAWDVLNKVHQDSMPTNAKMKD